MSKRRGEDSWPGGRGGLSACSRNTPGGRGLGSRSASDEVSDERPPGSASSPIHSSEGYSSPGHSWGKQEKERGDRWSPPAKDGAEPGSWIKEKMERDAERKQEKGPSPPLPSSTRGGWSSSPGQSWRRQETERGDETSPPSKDNTESGSCLSPKRANKESDVKERNAETPPGSSPARVGGAESDTWMKQEPPIPSPRRGGVHLPLGPQTRSDVRLWRRSSPQPTSPMHSGSNSPISPPHQLRPRSPHYQLASASSSQRRSPPCHVTTTSSSQTAADAPSWIRHQSSSPAPPPPPPPLSENTLEQFLAFLNGYTVLGDEDPLYKACLLMLRQLVRPELSVDFSHLIAWDRDLARDICNCQGIDEGLKTKAKSFFADNGFLTEKANIAFVNMPTRITRGVAAFIALGSLLMEVKLFGKVDALISTFRCSQACDAVISVVFASIASGMSWQGKLTSEDMDFIERKGKIKAVITREPSIHSNANVDDKVLDVHSLWPILEPMVTKGGKMPVYFNQLKNDLQGATADLISSDWFSLYIEYHPSLMPSMGRRNLETGVFQILDIKHLYQYSDYREYFSQWSMHDDWRELAWSDEYLETNFKHRGRIHTPGREKFVQGDGAKAVIFKGKGEDENTEDLASGVVTAAILKTSEDVNQAGDAKEESVGDGSEGGNTEKSVDLNQAGVPFNEKPEPDDQKHSKEMPAMLETSKKASLAAGENESIEQKKRFEISQHENTRWGLLRFRRDVHTHPEAMGSFYDLDETEIYLAGFISDLPNLIRLLLQSKKMHGRFATVWSSYMTSKADPRRLPPNVVKTWQPV